MNATKKTHANIFDTKEQYLAFRKRWKDLHAEGFHKPQPEPQKIFDERTGKLDTVGYHRVSPMHAGYHFIFNLALGRDLEKAFPSYRDKEAIRSRLFIIVSRYNSGIFFDVFGDTLSSEQRVLLQNKTWEIIRSAALN